MLLKPIYKKSELGVVAPAVKVAEAVRHPSGARVEGETAPAMSVGAKPPIAVRKFTALPSTPDESASS